MLICMCECIYGTYVYVHVCVHVYGVYICMCRCVCMYVCLVCMCARMCQTYVFMWLCIHAKARGQCWNLLPHFLHHSSFCFEVRSFILTSLFHGGLFANEPQGSLASAFPELGLQACLALLYRYWRSKLRS